MKKRNQEYWRNRFDLLEQMMNDIAQDTYLNLEKAFEKAQAKLNREIAYWVNKFADNNKVSLEEARKMLSANELKEFKWSVEEYIKYGEENNLSGLWVKQLKNASARYHISRLEAMKIQTQQIIESVYDEELSTAEGMVKNIYSQNYYRSVYEIQKAFGIGFVINEINESKLNALIHKPWAPDGQNFSDRIWRNKTQMVNELHQEMVRIAVTGEHPKVVIDKLTKYVDKKYRTAKRQASALVMTECAFFSSASQGEAFKNLGVEKFEVVATLDGKTTKICQEMDGKVFPEELREPGVTCNPFHVGCRSTTCPYFDDEFTEGEMRAARNEDGEVYYVPADMKYPEWYEKYVAGNPDELLKMKKRKNRGNDRKQYDKYKKIFKTDFPETFDKFVYMKYNNSGEWEKFKIKKADFELKEKIQNHYNLNIHEGRQGKHIKGHNNYNGKSYLSDGIDPQELVKKYAGTGEIKRGNQGKWTKKEMITASEIIGVVIDQDTGEEIETNYFSISYSEKGVHIVPRIKKAEGK